MGLMQSWSFASGAVGQPFDADWTTLMPARCFLLSKFFYWSYGTISVGKEHTFLTFGPTIPFLAEMSNKANEHARTHIQFPNRKGSQEDQKKCKHLYMRELDACAGQPPGTKQGARGCRSTACATTLVWAPGVPHGPWWVEAQPVVPSQGSIGSHFLQLGMHTHTHTHTQTHKHTHTHTHARTLSKYRYIYSTYCVSQWTVTFKSTLQGNAGRTVHTRRRVTNVACTVWPIESVNAGTVVAVH